MQLKTQNKGARHEHNLWVRKKAMLTGPKRMVQMGDSEPEEVANACRRGQVNDLREDHRPLARQPAPARANAMPTVPPGEAPAGVPASRADNATPTATARGDATAAAAAPAPAATTNTTTNTTTDTAPNATTATEEGEDEATRAVKAAKAAAAEEVAADHAPPAETEMSKGSKLETPPLPKRNICVKKKS